MREPERSEGQWRGETFCLLLRRLSKVSRREGGTRRAPWRIQWISPQTNQKIKRSQPAAAPTGLTEILRQAAVTSGQVIRRGGRHVFAADLASCVQAFVPTTGMQKVLLQRQQLALQPWQAIRA